MHINDLDQFSTMTMYTLANNTIMPSMKENISLVVKIWAFQDFYFMPCILINMHNIDTKNNRDHLRAMGYLGTTYAMHPTYRSWDFVFTSFFRQNHIKLRPLCILMIFNILKWPKRAY